MRTTHHMGSNIHTRELSLFLIIISILYCRNIMAISIFRLFLVLLALSHLLSLQAIPITRTENLMQGRPQVHVVSENTHKITAERKLELEEPSSVITERMELELHDYPPSGANNRHTPRAP